MNITSTTIVCLVMATTAFGQGIQPSGKFKGDVSAAAAAEMMPRPTTQLRPNTRLFDVRAKLKVLSDAGATETTLDAPFKLTPQSPYLNDKTYIQASQVTWFTTHGEQPSFEVSGYHPPQSHPVFAVNFEARTDRTYLVDCVAGGSGEYKTQIGAANETPVRNDHVRIQDGHLTAVLRKGAAGGAPRQATFSIIPTGGAGFGIAACEITPVR